MRAFLKNNDKFLATLLVLFVTVMFIAVAKKIKNNKFEHLEPVASTSVKEEAPPPTLKYGIPVDTFFVIEDYIKRGETLANILSGYNVSNQVINKLASKAKDVFDVRKMVAGNKFNIFCTTDASQQARCFIYEANPADYVVFDINAPYNVYKGRKHVDTLVKHASGIIYSSLYETMVNSGLSPLLTNELSDIFAWQIDFFRVQEGDRFKVIYEEAEIDGQPIGLGKILGACFKHYEEDFYAVLFEDDGKEGYFDEEANSLQKVFLKAPLKYSRISSGYSYRRYHPIQKRYKAHLGTDYAAPRGTPILAVGDGIIAEASYKKYNGRYVKIRHNSIYASQYLHMQNIAKGIHPGKRVKQGQVIGYVGSTGLATGPHVCYRFWKHGSQVNHLRQKFPPSRPIKKENLKAYNKVKEQTINELKSIRYRLSPEIIALND